MGNITGHNRQKKYFHNVMTNGNLAHAYLFTGPEMTGKRTFALEFLRSLNGRELSSEPDFIKLGPDSEEEHKISITEIRKLKSFFKLKPQGPYKMALIDDVHNMTGEASNALLKLLEEPPGFSVIILVSSLPGLILPTIVSRCEKVIFNCTNDKEAGLYLDRKKVNQEDKDFLLKLAGGRIGLMEKLINEKGIDNARKAIDDLRKLLNSGVYERMDYAKKLNESENYRPTVEYWLGWVSAHIAASPKNEKIIKDLLSLQGLISQPQYNHRLALENFLLNL